MHMSIPLPASLAQLLAFCSCRILLYSRCASSSASRRARLSCSSVFDMASVRPSTSDMLAEQSYDAASAMALQLLDCCKRPRAASCKCRVAVMDKV